MKFLCDNCKAKYQIGDEKVAGKTVRMKCRRCGHTIVVSSRVTEGSVSRGLPTEEATSAGSATLEEPSKDAESEEERTVIMSPGVMPVPAPRPAPPPPRPSGAGAPPAVGGGRPLPPPRGGLAAIASSAAARPAPPPRPQRPEGLASMGGLGASTVESASRSRSLEAGRGMAGAFNRAVVDQPAPPAAAASARPAPLEDWFVGISGVPTGPLRLAVIREKAASGLIDAESLVWREGFDEWQPLKKFPELAEVVRTAQARPAAYSPFAPRVSATPAPPEVEPEAPLNGTNGSGPYPAVRGSMPGQPRDSAFASSGDVRASAPLFSTPTPAPAAANGTDRMSASSMPWAAAPTSATPPPPTPAPGGTVDVLSDPFAVAPAPVAAAAPFAAAPVAMAPTNGASHAPSAPVALAPIAPSDASDLDRRPRRGMHPMAIAFIAAAAMFGAVAAYTLLSKPPPAPQIVVVQPAQQQPQTATTTTAAPAITGEVAVSDPTVTSPQGRVPGTGGPLPKNPADVKTGTPVSPLDTTNLAPKVPGPSSDPDTNPNSGGGQLSQGEIQGVVSSNQARVRRKCWQPALDAKSPSAPSNARVNASITIAPSGSVSSATASGGEKDFPGLSSCIQSSLQGWKFPPSGTSSTVSIPFVFAGQ